REAGGEEGLLLRGLRDEIRFVTGFGRLVLTCARGRLVARPVKPPIREVDEDPDSRGAGGLEERTEAPAPRPKERRVHDGRGPVLGEHALEDGRVGRVAAHDSRAGVAGEHADALFFVGAPVPSVVEGIEEDDALARAKQSSRDGRPEEASPSGDEDDAHGVARGVAARLFWASSERFWIPDLWGSRVRQRSALLSLIPTRTSFIASATAGSAISLPAVPSFESSFAATFARW